MKLTNQEKSAYLAWVILNIIMLLCFGQLKFENRDFYPFSRGFERIEDYDIAEFLAYTIIPLLIILAIKFSKSEQRK